MYFNSFREPKKDYFSMLVQLSTRGFDFPLGQPIGVYFTKGSKKLYRVPSSPHRWCWNINGTLPTSQWLRCASKQETLTAYVTAWIDWEQRIRWIILKEKRWWIHYLLFDILNFIKNTYLYLSLTLVKLIFRQVTAVRL